MAIWIHKQCIIFKSSESSNRMDYDFMHLKQQVPGYAEQQHIISHRFSKRLTWFILRQWLITRKTVSGYKICVHFILQNENQIYFYLAIGEPCAALTVGKSIVPDSKTLRPGMNFRLLGFGVSWVWMNIVLTGTWKVKWKLLFMKLCKSEMPSEEVKNEHVPERLKELWTWLLHSCDFLLTGESPLWNLTWEAHLEPDCLEEQ